MCGILRRLGSCLCNIAVGVLKLCLWIVNVFFWVVGCFLMGVCIWLLVEGPANSVEAIISDMDDSMWVTAVALTLTVGCLMFLIGFLGCCGLMQESASMLCWYSILMVCVLVIQCTIGIFVAIAVNDFEDYADDNFDDQVEHEYYHPDHLDLTEAWDDMQQNLECCGGSNYLSYIGSFYSLNTTNNVPESCCDDQSQTGITECRREAGESNPDFDYLYSAGCTKEAKDWANDYAVIFYCVIYILAACELVCIFFGFVGWWNIKNQDSNPV